MKILNGKDIDFTKIQYYIEVNYYDIKPENDRSNAIKFTATTPDEASDIGENQLITYSLKASDNLSDITKNSLFTAEIFWPSCFDLDVQ